MTPFVPGVDRSPSLTCADDAAHFPRYALCLGIRAMRQHLIDRRSRGGDIAFRSADHCKISPSLYVLRKVANLQRKCLLGFGAALQLQQSVTAVVVQPLDRVQRAKANLLSR